MTEITAQTSSVRQALLGVGFLEDRLRADLPIPGSTDRVPLIAFANQPFDSRTASIAVLQGQQLTESDVAAIRSFGTPLVFACLPDRYELWKQGVVRPEFHLRLQPDELPKFFERHRRELTPESIYRAKIWGRLEHSFQLDFVDVGFLPLVEQEAGRKLTELIERVVSDTKLRLSWRDVSATDGRWLLQATFWLLAAKILQDKFVPGFVRLDIGDVEEVYARLARHYNREHPRPVQVRSAQRHDALVSAATQIKAFAHCGLVSTEALAHVYESALIDRTTRQKLGTHSTPTWLVDYIVGRLRPWVESDIAVEDRRVFEPACGHAGFLISAMRLLSELLPTDWHQPRRTYLRERLQGLEADSFALEIARLSLTLADVPNPNGWVLNEGNMFKADHLQSAIRGSTIVLGNPPFEDFERSERQSGWLANKAAETFRNVIDYLPKGGVFGFVLPQTFLRARQATEVRRILIRDYEIAEISLFADKVFRYGEPESAVIIGRRLTHHPTNGSVIRYQRTREGQIEEFKRTYQPGSTIDVPQQRLAQTEGASLLVADLDQVWQALAPLKKLEEFADIGQGFIHKADDDPTLPAGVIKESPVARRGLVPGFARWGEKQLTHELPNVTWLNLDPKTIRRPMSGTKTGKPQVILNYAPVSRAAWRLKALIDLAGHPVTSRFNVLRPKTSDVSLFVFWAICNSPVANAYVYCKSSKRDVLAGELREMPVPDLTKRSLNALELAVSSYLRAAKTLALSATGRSLVKNRKGDPRQLMLEPLPSALESVNPAEELTQEKLKFLHWRIDAEVLRLYNLPDILERKILDLFRGIARRGVPFDQTEYFRKDFTDLNRLADLLAITVDWAKTNRRRAKLMDLDEVDELTASQAIELQNLQYLADASVSLMKPSTTEEIDQVVERLKRSGVWTE